VDAAINQQRLIEIPESVIDIDIMMGERTGTGHGVGSAAIRLVADAALSDPSCRLSSLRAFAKAGFRGEREFDDVPSGRCVLMVQRRQRVQNR
jgi:RimJ/RimL family protein N-acetyltransferase